MVPSRAHCRRLRRVGKWVLQQGHLRQGPGLVGMLVRCMLVVLLLVVVVLARARLIIALTAVGVAGCRVHGACVSWDGLERLGLIWRLLRDGYWVWAFGDCDCIDGREGVTAASDERDATQKAGRRGDRGDHVVLLVNTAVKDVVTASQLMNIAPQLVENASQLVEIASQPMDIASQLVEGVSQLVNTVVPAPQLVDAASESVEAQPGFVKAESQPVEVRPKLVQVGDAIACPLVHVGQHLMQPRLSVTESAVERADSEPDAGCNPVENFLVIEFQDLVDLTGLDGNSMVSLRAERVSKGSADLTEAMLEVMLEVHDPSRDAFGHLPLRRVQQAG